MDLPNAANLKVSCTHSLLDLTMFEQSTITNRRPEAPTSVANPLPEETAFGMSVESHTIGYYMAHVHQIKLSETHRVRYVREPGVALLMQNILTYGWDPIQLLLWLRISRFARSKAFPHYIRRLA